MQDILTCAMGLDIHRDVIVACLAKGELGTDPEIEIRSFSTLIPEMRKLRDWVLEAECRYVATVVTGTYNFPGTYNIFNLMGAASRTLREHGMDAQAKEMCDRITGGNCHSYHEALCIISEYVETELSALQDQSKGKKEKHAYER